MLCITPSIPYLPTAIRVLAAFEWSIDVCVCACVQLEAAMRIASGELFPTSWVEFDQRAKDLESRTNAQK